MGWNVQILRYSQAKKIHKLFPIVFVTLQLPVPLKPIVQFQGGLFVKKKKKQKQNKTKQNKTKKKNGFANGGCNQSEKLRLNLIDFGLI